MPNVLIASPDQRKWLGLLDHLLSRGLAAESVDTFERALKSLRDTPHVCGLFDTVLLGDGLVRMAQLRGEFPQLSLVVLSQAGSIQQAVQAIKAGAEDYFAAPADCARIETLVRALAPNQGIAVEDGVVAVDPLSQELLALTRKVARSRTTVLITGESGSGKEIIARLLHRSSPCSAGPFVAINCAAIPENMLEAMLFGYERGAFTGATETRPGKFESANKGTLLLDEISEMDLSLQAKLLRVLQEREVERIGGKRVIPLDVRVVATSNRNLGEEVAGGRFREDLFYRLAVFPLHVPALRDRPFDILPLASFVIEGLAGEQPVPRLTERAGQKLTAYHWPGNVRELENVLQRAMILHCGGFIKAADLRLDGTTLSSPPALATAAAGDGLGAALQHNEGQLIIEALAAENGRKKQAAERLGISARTLRYKLAKLRDAGVTIP